MLFRRIFLTGLGLIGLLPGLTGCVSNPPTNVYQPMTVKPVERKVLPPADGAIFHAGINERPLFEDKRARNIGDILTINIVEKVTGDRKSNSGSTFANSATVNTPGVTVGTLAKVLLKAFSVTGSSDNSATTTGFGAASANIKNMLMSNTLFIIFSYRVPTKSASRTKRAVSPVSVSQVTSVRRFPTFPRLMTDVGSSTSIRSTETTL